MPTASKKKAIFVFLSYFLKKVEKKYGDVSTKLTICCFVVDRLWILHSMFNKYALTVILYVKFKYVKLIFHI